MLVLPQILRRLQLQFEFWILNVQNAQTAESVTTAYLRKSSYTAHIYNYRRRIGRTLTKVPTVISSYILPTNATSMQQYVRPNKHTWQSITIHSRTSAMRKINNQQSTINNSGLFNVNINNKRPVDETVQLNIEWLNSNNFCLIFFSVNMLCRSRWRSTINNQQQPNTAKGEQKIPPTSKHTAHQQNNTTNRKVKGQSKEKYLPFAFKCREWHRSSIRPSDAIEKLVLLKLWSGCRTGGSWPVRTRSFRCFLVYVTKRTPCTAHHVREYQVPRYRFRPRTYSWRRRKIAKLTLKTSH